MSDVASHLRANNLFADLPDDILTRIANVTHSHSLDRGEWLFHQGDTASEFFLVVKGRLRLVQHTLDGRDISMSVFVPGDPIGLIVALIDEPYPGSAEALEYSRVLAVPPNVVWEAMHRQTGLAVRVLRIMAERLHEAHNRIRELSSERVQQRIARATLRLVEKVGVEETDNTIRLDLSLSRQDLAQLSGTTLETVSRTLTSWEQSGIVETGREQLTILKFDRLFTIAEGFAHPI